MLNSFREMVDNVDQEKDEKADHKQSDADEPIELDLYS